MIGKLATKPKSFKVSREELVEVIRKFQKEHTLWCKCPNHEYVISDWLQQSGLYLERLEPLGSYKGYIVHYHERCPW